MNQAKAAKTQKGCSLFHSSAAAGGVKPQPVRYEWMSLWMYVALPLLPARAFVASCVASEAKRLFSFTFIRVNNDRSNETTNHDFFLSPISPTRFPTGFID